MAGHPIFEVDYAELERFAQEHDLNAAELLQWAAGDPGFAEKYLATHGKVNFGTYLRIVDFMASKLAAGTAFAERNTLTSTALRGVISATINTDANNGAPFGATETAV